MLDSMPGGQPQNCLSILLIEDNLADQRLVELALLEASRDMPCKAFPVSTLAEGLTQLAARQFDAILLDLGLPDAQGLDGLRAVQAVQSTAPIIVLTGYADFATARTALQVGAADYLDKGELQPRPLVRAIGYAIERVQKDRALRESQLRFRNFLLASPDGVLIMDKDGTIVLASKRAETMFGYGPGELDGLSVSRLKAGRGDGSQPTDRPLDFSQTSYGLRKDGSRFPIEVSFSPSTGGVSDATIAAVRDISDRKAIENQLLKAQKMEAIGTLTGGMAHDFNNLLAVVIGNLDLLAEGGGLSRDNELLVSEALDAALRGADLTRRLLAFARRQPLQPKQIAVNDLVNELCKLARRTLGANIDIRFHPDRTVSPIVADPAQLEACLFNIINNARDAMVDGGEITISTYGRCLDADLVTATPDLSSGYYTIIEVRDNGSGMPPEVVSQIFEPFFTTKEPGRGTGLGLSLVYGFIKQSGGQVHVYSEVGAGTIFRLYLPSVVTPADARDGVAASGRVAEPRGTETILAVEDNSGLRQVVCLQIKGLGYRFLEAHNGQEALSVLEREHVDLLFTDVVMPGGMSGYELANIVASRWPQVKVVVTSGFPETKTDSNGHPPRNLRLLTKPYRRHELANALRAALDGAS